MLPPQDSDSTSLHRAADEHQPNSGTATILTCVCGTKIAVSELLLPDVTYTCSKRCSSRREFGQRLEALALRPLQGNEDEWFRLAKDQTESLRQQILSEIGRRGGEARAKALTPKGRKQIATKDLKGCGDGPQKEAGGIADSDNSSGEGAGTGR